MASYHLSVKSISRSAGRSAVAAAAYRSGERLFDARYGVEHDYTRKGGVEHTELVAPEDAPDWAQDRDRLWNEAEANENRKNSMVAREWEVALPAELSDADRRALAVGFARTLVDRYGVVADVAVHAPHREGDDRNHHAHILTTTREIGADGFGAKTRILDVKQTASVEVSEMREHWAERQNEALERMGAADRVDHRTLEAQREEVEAERDRLARDLEVERQEAEQRARDRILGRPDSDRSDSDRDLSVGPKRSLSREERILDQAGLGVRSSEGQQDRDWSELERRLARKTLEAAALDREPEVKLGPAANAMERRAARDAEKAGRSYEPVTDAGRQVLESRDRRSVFRDAIERLGVVRDRMTGAVRDVTAWLRTGEWPKEREDREASQIREREPSDPQSVPEREVSLSGTERFARRVYARIEAERRADLEKRLAALGRGHKAPEVTGPDHQRDEAERRAGLQERLRNLARPSAPEKTKEPDRTREVSKPRGRDRDEDRGFDR